MKTALIVKFALVLPLILLADYIVMVLLGCASCLFTTGKDFYCGTYCLIGKGILLSSLIFFGYLVWKDVKKVRDRNKHGQTV